MCEGADGNHLLIAQDSLVVQLRIKQSPAPTTPSLPFSSVQPPPQTNLPCAYAEAREIAQVREPAGRVYLRGSAKAPTAAASLTTAAAAAAQRVIGSSGLAIAAAFHAGSHSGTQPDGPIRSAMIQVALSLQHRCHQNKSILLNISFATFSGTN